jgi:urease accessory protein
VRVKTGNEISSSFELSGAQNAENRQCASEVLKNDFVEALDGGASNRKRKFSAGTDRKELSDPDTPAKMDWLVLQLADSAFPAGGFAHSNGLEAAWQQGEIRSSSELIEFVEVHLAQTARAALPFVNEAYHSARPYAEIDGLCDVFLSNHVANRSSRAQGQAFLFASAQAFESACLRNLRAEVSKEKLPGHLAPAFGRVLRLLKIGHPVCSRLFLFMNARTLMASAVRLGIIGPMAAQSIQWRIAPYAEKVAFGCSGLRLAEVAQTSPLLDILQGAHDRLYSRLFQT